MSIKKLSNLNYPPPFLWLLQSFCSLTFGFCVCLMFRLLFYCKLLFESTLHYICLEYCGIFIFFAYNE